MILDDMDKKLLNALQERFEAVARPYLEIAKSLGIEETEVIERIKRLKEAGIIRRIGALFDGNVLGFVGTLCAAKVAPEAVDAFAAIINAYPQVTHNYLREGEYNVWFTVSAPSEAELEALIAEMKGKTGVAEILSFRARQTFKLDARFTL